MSAEEFNASRAKPTSLTVPTATSSSSSSSKPKISCNRCHKGFKTNKALSVHMATRHQEQEQVKARVVGPDIINKKARVYTKQKGKGKYYVEYCGEGGGGKSWKLRCRKKIGGKEKKRKIASYTG